MRGTKVLAWEIEKYFSMNQISEQKSSNFAKSNWSTKRGSRSIEKNFEMERLSKPNAVARTSQGTDSERGEGRVDLDLPEIEFGIENENFKKNGIEVVGTYEKKMMQMKFYKNVWFINQLINLFWESHP